MRSKRRRWLKRIVLAALALLVVAAGASILLLAPALAAYACPRCYGFARVGDGLFVDPPPSAAERAGLIALVGRAESQVATFYGAFERHPTLLVCTSAACDAKLRGKGARAQAYGASFITVSPRGIDQTILAHELAHIELHGRLGAWRLWRGGVAAWFDEGLAVIIADDARYLNPGPMTAARCKVEPVDDLPVSRGQWAPRAGRTPDLYAHAACAVLRWMERNGGRAGLLQAIAETASGARTLP